MCACVWCCVVWELSRCGVVLYGVVWCDVVSCGEMGGWYRVMVCGVCVVVVVWRVCVCVCV